MDDSGQDFAEWPPEELKGEPLSFWVGFSERPRDQPGFSLSLEWNKPGIDARPFAVVKFWRRCLTVGWVFT